MADIKFQTSSIWTLIVGPSPCFRLDCFILRTCHEGPLGVYAWQHVFCQPKHRVFSRAKEQHLRKLNSFLETLGSAAVGLADLSNHAAVFNFLALSEIFENPMKILIAIQCSTCRILTDRLIPFCSLFILILCMCCSATWSRHTHS